MLTRILIGSGLLVLLYNLFFFDTSLQIGFGLLFFIVNAYLFVTRKFSSFLPWGLASSILATLFGTFVGIWDNTTIQVLDVVVGLFFTGIAAYFYNATGKFSFEIPRFIVAPIFAAVSAVANTLSFVLSNPLADRQDKSHITSGLIRGVLIALPVCVLLLILFSGADPVFGKYVGNLTKNISARLITSVIVLIISFIAGFASLKLDSKEEKPTNTAGKVYELALASGLISLLILLFGVVQFKYLFSSVGERELHRIGIESLTYSEYVRRGFFELLIASGISSVVIIYILRFVDYLKGKEKRIVQGMSVVLTAGIGLLLASAFKRLMLYQDAHGLTEARILGFVFLVWMTAILILFLVKLLSSMRRKMFFTSSFGLTLMVLVALNVVNIDQIVATKYPPTVNNKIDYAYLSGRTGVYTLWPEMIAEAERNIAILEAKQTLEWTDQELYFATSRTVSNLSLKMRGLVLKYGDEEEKKLARKHVMWNGPDGKSTVVSYNLTEKRAYDALKSRKLYMKVWELNDRVGALGPRVYGPYPSEQISTPTPTFDPNTPPVTASPEQMGQ